MEPINKRKGRSPQHKDTVQTHSRVPLPISTPHDTVDTYTIHNTEEILQQCMYGTLKDGESLAKINNNTIITHLFHQIQLSTNHFKLFKVSIFL